VTKSHLFIAMTGCLLVAGLAVFTAPAQGPGVAGTPVASPRIAMLDVSYIFKEHAGFKARSAALEAEAEQAKQRMKQESESINNLVADLHEGQRTKPGSQEVKDLEEMIAKRRADLQVQLQLQNKEFMLKEANIYHAVYQEIEREVDYFAKQNGIDAVLRFNGDPVEKGQPNQILRYVNKQVVWFAPDLDITKIILDRLNMRYGGGTRQTANPNDPGQRSRHGVPAPSYQR